jgi:hypothetical protein
MRFSDQLRRGITRPRLSTTRTGAALIERSRLVLAAVFVSGGGTSAEVVGASGRQPRPLGDGTSVGAELLALAADPPPLRPAGGRVFPGLLPPVDGEVHERVAVVHGLDAADGRPVGFEDAVAVSYVAHEVHHADPPPDQQDVEGGLCGVPRHVPAHEVVVADAFVVGTLTEDRVGDVAGMQVGQLTDLRCHPSAPLALLGGGSARVPHEVVGDELSVPFERVEQGERPVGPDQWRAGVCLDHGEAPSGRGDGVAFPGVRLLSNPQPVQFGLEGGPVDHCRQRRGVEATGHRHPSMLRLIPLIGILLTHWCFLLSAPACLQDDSWGAEMCLQCAPRPRLLTEKEQNCSHRARVLGPALGRRKISRTAWEGKCLPSRAPPPLAACTT